MKAEEWQDLLVAGLQQAGVEALPDAAALGKLFAFQTELLKWNQRYNLVSRSLSLPEILENHFLDSLLLLPLVIDFRNAMPSAGLLDIGSGAGFPGMVLKIACPELPVTLAEPRAKRVAFLKHVRRTLALEGLSVLAERIEAGGAPPPGGMYGLVVSRAFASLDDFLALAADVCVPGGMAVSMKGRRGREELMRWQEASGDGVFRFTAVQDWKLPYAGAERQLLVFTKRPG